MKPLDPRTLRCVSRRLRTRAKLLDKKERLSRKQGHPPNQFRIGRAMECDLQADNCLAEARRIEARR